MNESGTVNIREDVKFVTVNFIGTGKYLDLRHFPLAPARKQPAKTETDGVKKSEANFVQLFENVMGVSGGILERALCNNGLVLAAVYFSIAPEKPGTDTSKPWYVQKRQLKLVFKLREILDEGEIVRQDFSEAQIAEVRSVLRGTFKFCHAKFFAGPIPNLQIAMLQPTLEKPIRQITVREGEIQTVLLRDLTPEEIGKEIGRETARDFVRDVLSEAI